jgi:hypothetical protein
MSVDNLFTQATLNSFSTLKVEDLKTIALAIWYENFTPDVWSLDHASIEQQQKAAYLIDRLMRYNCVSVERKFELLRLVQYFQTQLHFLPYSTENYHVEPLAQAWGLKEDVSRLMPPLLEYQTRHYVHE